MRFSLFLASAALLGLTACAPQSGEGQAGRAGPTVSSGVAQVGGPFTLVDETGATVTEAELLGQPTLVYFGFTFCPDICPTSLQRMGRAQELMGDMADEVQFLFVTIDPERDTPEQMAVYVTNNGFPEGLRGFTGTPEQIEAAAKAYLVVANRVELDESDMGYTMDHTDLIYLMGKDGSFVSFYGPSQTPADIAVGVRRYLQDSA